MAELFEHDVIGLTTEEVKKRQLRYGSNELSHRRKFAPLISFIKKFNNPLLLILVVAATISFFVGERINGVIIVSMILISGIVDFVNSYRSEKAIEKLIARVVTTATVLRDGIKHEVPFAELVPGDFLLLSAGDVVPADARVIKAKDLFINQSALTGEAFPVEKEALADVQFEMSPQSPYAVCMGTSIVTGFALVEVLAIGKNTEFGKIAESLSLQPPETDFEKGIREFSIFIVRVTAVLVTFVFLANVITDKGWLNSFLFALAIAIGLTPELLPVILAVSLSHGASKMAKKDVIVKNLSSIQSLGSMDILCTDKTGTLTENRITLIKHVDCFGNDSESVFLFSYLSSTFHTGVRGPLDEAICVHEKLPMHGYEKIDEIPFDFTRKKDSIVVENNEENHNIIISKGAPEDIFAISQKYMNGDKEELLTDEMRKKIHEKFIEYSKDGYRVLAVATRHMPHEHRVFTKNDESDMTILGFTAFIDPPKATAQKAISDLNEFGVEIKILTGDNELLTAKICKDIKLTIKEILLGSDIAKMTDEELGNRAEATTIFARITPDQKERIIVALKNKKHSVGYLGDGINDAPALKAADVGISVNNAVDVAKETADIILIRKSLRVLHEGIYEGRHTFQNAMKYISMGLSSNFGNMASMTGASVMLPFLPMLPGQILLNNVLYDMSQLTITSDSVDKEDIMKPLKWNMGYIKKYMVSFGLLSSIFDFSTFGLLYFVFKLSPSQFQTGWFIESFATQVFVIYIIRTKRIPFIQSSPSLALFLSTFLLVTFAWILPLTPLGSVFSFVTLPLSVYGSIAMLLITYLVLAEILKRWFYKSIVHTA